MDFLPNLIKQGKFIDTISGLTIFINSKTDIILLKIFTYKKGIYRFQREKIVK